MIAIAGIAVLAFVVAIGVSLIRGEQPPTYRAGLSSASQSACTTYWQAAHQRGHGISYKQLIESYGSAAAETSDAPLHDDLLHLQAAEVAAAFTSDQAATDQLGTWYEVVDRDCWGH